MAEGCDQGWYLEGCLEGERMPRRFMLRSLPARVGRGADVDVRLPTPQVSSNHAEIYRQGERLWLRDLGSSNGTYLNREPLAAPQPLHSGDVVHFAQVELLIGREAPKHEDVNVTTLVNALSADLLSGAHSRARALRELLDNATVRAVFQPIVSLAGLPVSAYEVLGRGASIDLPGAPGPLFKVAEEAGLAAELSRVLRAVGLAAAVSLPRSPRVFTNAHPSELADGTLLEDLARLRAMVPRLRLVLEVHEATATDPAAMRALRRRLQELDVQLAYDDFGAGQARLLELAECPPDCLKFDMSLIRDLDTAPGHRQHVVETLVRIAQELGVRCVAEGVERAGELDVCSQMGFEFAQGYYIARPAPADSFRPGWRWEHPGISVPDEPLGVTVEMAVPVLR